MSCKDDLFEILIKRIDKLSNSLDNLINIQLSKEIHKMKHENIDYDLEDMRKRKRRKLNNNNYQEINNLEINNQNVNNQNVNNQNVNNHNILDNLEKINKTLELLSIDSSKLSHTKNHTSLINKYKEQDNLDNHDDMRHLYIN